MRHEPDTGHETESAGLPARDEAAALATTGGDADLARELLATLMQGLSADLRRLAGHVQGEDWPGVAQIAHRMRGATSYCGVPALDMSLLMLERAAKASDVEQILAGVALVEQEAERLRGWNARYGRA